MKLYASGEDYLETILILNKKMGMVRSVDVARHMGVSKPRVCVAVNTLKDGGFLTMDEDHFLHLTALGWKVAEQTYEKHLFFTNLLTEVGVDEKNSRAGCLPDGTCHQRGVLSEAKETSLFNAEKRRGHRYIERVTMGYFPF